jgi:hypothetical protein
MTTQISQPLIHRYLGFNAREAARTAAACLQRQAKIAGFA